MSNEHRAPTAAEDELPPTLRQTWREKPIAETDRSLRTSPTKPNNGPPPTKR